MMGESVLDVNEAKQKQTKWKITFADTVWSLGNGQLHFPSPASDALRRFANVRSTFLM